MSVNFSEKNCQETTNSKLFGLCDDPPPPHKPAYIDENDGSKWVAVVVNEDMYQLTFTAIDHCITINRPDGKPAKRCDGALTYNSTIIFVELKQIGAKGSDWIITAEEQLRTTIGYFELEEDADNYNNKKAYIASSERPKFRVSQAKRMDQFFDDTGYVLRIENRIILQ
jgi:hypothetical protein